ncbi:hypothetical protein RRG08_028925 [Elysia crispata]|uniref:Uncharacterized protein n=1 Tax=Elysia crispata TaxID=231223 RepID=A0AAE1E2P8_9GAST|nr:hypothetical protein RRG08_028925 [Elysia crispata]
MTSKSSCSKSNKALQDNTSGKGETPVRTTYGTSFETCDSNSLRMLGRILIVNPLSIESFKRRVFKILSTRLLSIVPSKRLLRIDSPASLD